MLNEFSRALAAQPLSIEEAQIMFWISFGTIALVGIIQIFMVYMTRRSLLFGVRIPESKTKDRLSMALKNRYYILTIVVTILTLIGYYLFAQQASAKAILISSIVVYLPLLAIHSLVYIYCWKKALSLKAEQEWFVPSKQSAQIAGRGIPGAKIPYALYLIPLLIIAAVSVYALSQYDQLPAQIPSHFDIKMQPDAWEEKSVSFLLFPFFMSIFITAMMIGSNLMIVKQKLQVSVEQPELSYAQHRAYRRLMSRVLAGFNLSFILLFSVIILLTIDALPKTLSSILSFASFGLVMLATLALTIVGMKAGQSGANLKPEILEEDRVLAYGRPSSESSKEVLIDRQDDKYWILGTFYFNKQDSALLIENRFGSNTGFNYAHPASWVITVLLILAIVVPLWWMIAQIP